MNISIMIYRELDKYRTLEEKEMSQSIGNPVFREYFMTSVVLNWHAVLYIWWNYIEKTITTKVNPSVGDLKSDI